MDLIPDSIHAQIRAALHDVTDTFCDTPILYKRYVGTMDRYAEDRKELNSDYQEYNLMAFVEWETLNKNNTQETLNGSINPTIIDVMFNYDDLDSVGLIDSECQPRMSSDKDYFMCNGVMYRVSYVYPDGAFQRNNVLVMMRGSIQPERS